MNNQKNENFKKITITLVVLALLGVSHYYYSDDSGCTKKQVSKPQKIAVKKEVKKAKETKKPEKPAEKQPETPTETPTETPPEIQPEQKTVHLKGIEPTSKEVLAVNSMGMSGKNDPFSYTESNFIPLSLNNRTGMGHRSGTLPVPPSPTEYTTANPAETVIIKGFLGNKVIAQIKGLTESLSANESLQGIKVVSVDPANRSCVFIVDGQTVTKTMKPINPINDNIKINYVNNQ